MGEMEDNNPIQKEIPSPLKKLYMEIAKKYMDARRAKEYDARAEIDFADAANRQENIEEIEEKSRQELEEIKKKIESFASAVGVQFDPDTGEVRFGEIKDLDISKTQSQDLQQTQEQLKVVKGKYFQSTKELYGNRLKKDPELDDDEELGPGKVEEVNEKKSNLMQRDQSANRLLKAKVDLELAKDRLDMHTAIYVAHKHRVMMRLEQAKIELLQTMAIPGVEENDTRVQKLKLDIRNFTLQLAGIDAQFEQETEGFMSEFKAATAALESSKKDVEIGDKKVANAENKYSVTANFSEAGIRNGTTVEGKKNGNSFREKEVYTENGDAVIGIEDVLSRTRSIRVGGVVVNSVTQFDSADGVQISSSADGREYAEINTNSSSSVEAKPDFEEELQNTESGAVTQISIMEQLGENQSRNILSEVYTPGILARISAEQELKFKIATAFKLLGVDKNTKDLSVESLRKLICEDIDKLLLAKELEERENEDPNPFEERRFQPPVN